MAAPRKYTRNKLGQFSKGGAVSKGPGKSSGGSSISVKGLKALTDGKDIKASFTPSKKKT